MHAVGLELGSQPGIVGGGGMTYDLPSLITTGPQNGVKPPTRRRNLSSTGIADRSFHNNLGKETLIIFLNLFCEIVPSFVEVRWW
jgi:hypothetical protein